MAHWYAHLYPEWASLPYWQHLRHPRREAEYLLDLARQEARDALVEDEAEAAAEAARGGQMSLLYLVDAGGR